MVEILFGFVFEFKFVFGLLWFLPMPLSPRDASEAIISELVASGAWSRSTELVVGLGIPSSNFCH